MTRITKNHATAKSSSIPSRNASLTITATPIGNLGDISERARMSLANADIIACEDTRHTGMMLKRLGITPTKMVSYHDHSKPATLTKLIAALKGGKAVTLVSDAGTPLLSDPGLKLVQACQHEAIPVIPVPGASALLAGLVVSGLPTDKFMFAGFLPQQSAKKIQQLKDMLTIQASLIFYESAKRLISSLEILAELAPMREIVVARELTKLNEEVKKDTAEGLLDYYKKMPARGEIVLLIAPPQPNTAMIDDAALRQMLERAIDDGYSRRDAAKIVSTATGLPKKKIYTIALQIDNSQAV